jgi:hypothetical protein
MAMSVPHIDCPGKDAIRHVTNARIIPIRFHRRYSYLNLDNPMDPLSAILASVFEPSHKFRSNVGST